MQLERGNAKIQQIVTKIGINYQESLTQIEGMYGKRMAWCTLTILPSICE